MSSIPEKVRLALSESVRPGKRILAAVSGGADSVCLMHVLRGLAWPFQVAHIDHGLRKGSRKDAEFVRTMARKWDIEFSLERVNVGAHTEKTGMGIEEAGRELRYEALAHRAHATRCSVIATAHTADDQAETVMMNWLRGSGPGGLAGIPPVRKTAFDSRVLLLRPMLHVARAEILSYLAGHQVPFREDPTNRQRRFRRNLIRHEMLPQLGRSYPGLQDRLVQAADIFREEEGFWAQTLIQELNKTVRKNSKKITVDLPHLLGYHKALGRRLLRHLLPGLSFQEIERVFTLAHSPKASSHVELAGGLFVTRQADQLVISRNS